MGTKMIIPSTLISVLLLAVLSLALPMHADGGGYKHALMFGDRGRNLNVTNTVNRTSTSALDLDPRNGTCSGRPRLYRKAWYVIMNTSND